MIAWDTLLEAATLAPSGDNTQPWTITCRDTQNQMNIGIDESRDPSPMNAGQRMSRIAVGAAAENVLATTAANRIQARASLSDDEIRIEIDRSASPSSIEIPALIRNRTTNRRPYSGAGVDVRKLRQLAARTPAVSGVRTLWVADPTRIKRLADLVAQADALMFQNEEIRQAFLRNIRFDLPAKANADEGLSLASLELPAGGRFGLAALRKMPQRFFKATGGSKMFSSQARRVVRSASGLCIIIADDRVQQTDYVVGAAMQRAWLALTEFGLAAQPMASIAVLDNALEHGSQQLKRTLHQHEVHQLLAKVAEELPEIAHGRLAFLLRFGFAPPPSGRCGRRRMPQR